MIVPPVIPHAAPRFEPRANAWLLSRHRDVAFALRDRRFSSDRSHRAEAAHDRPDPPSDYERARSAMFLFRDPPSHTGIRALAQRGFTRRTITALEARVREILRQLLDAATSLERIDFMHSVAEPLPVVAIAEILGLPTADRARLKTWSDDLAGLLLGSDPRPEGRERARESFLELRAYLQAVLAQREARHRDDLMAALLALCEPERSATAMLLLVAGHETTTSLLGGAVAALCEFPEERRRLQKDPDLLQPAVEEFLRFVSPIQATRRFALERVEVGGCAVAAGERVICLLGVANRDPGVFDEPDRLDVGRQPNRHLAFGSGIHSCLGANLARLEARVAIGELLRRFPHFALAAPRIEWRSSGLLRAPVALPLALAGAA